MNARSWWIVGAVVGALVGAPQVEVSAAPQAPVLKPTRKLASPAGTAKATAALARFANGQLGSSSYDQRVARVLGGVKGGRQTAKRLVQAIEAMQPTERAKLFPGVAKADTVTTNPFDQVGFRQVLVEKWGKLPQLASTVLAPDPYDPSDKAKYELLYRGMKCDKTADADGTDEPVTYVNVVSVGGGTYQQSPKYLPAAGAGSIAAGALSSANQGPVWTSQSWPGGWNSGIVVVTAVLEDNGDLDQRKEELELLVQFAVSETEEDNVTPDRIEVLRRELDDALALLHLANPERWSAKAVQVKKLTSAEYDDLYLKPSTPDPVAHKLTAQHDPRGGGYTLYFDIPPPNLSFKAVYVRVKELEALGSAKDAAENKIADLGAEVSIAGNTPASATRLFGADKNLVKPGWTVEREVQAGRTVSIRVRAFDSEAPPSCGCGQTSGWPYYSCTSYCATPEQKDQCKGIFSVYSPGGYGPSYSGLCPKGQVDYDLHPLPDSGDGWYASDYRFVEFTYDLATNKLAGDLSGAPGTFTVLGTDGAGNKARVVLEVGTK